LLVLASLTAGNGIYILRAYVLRRCHAHTQRERTNERAILNGIEEY